MNPPSLTFCIELLVRRSDQLSQCAMIALDYKLNFKPEKADGIPALQERVAERLYDLLTSNGGLYIKIGAHDSY